MKIDEKFCWRKGIVSAVSLLYVLCYPGPKGILYINPSDLGWNPPVSSWIDRREIQSERANLTILFDKYLPICLDTLRTRYLSQECLYLRWQGQGDARRFPDQLCCAGVVLHMAWVAGFLLAPESPEHHWLKLRETMGQGGAADVPARPSSVRSGFHLILI